jgi:hypothetical protein
MKSIVIQAIIEGLRAKKDRSLGLTISTPELNAQEKALFFELQGLLVDLKITPRDEEVQEQVINRDLEQKTQSQRIRNTLFILWKQNPEDMEFEQYYKNKTEKYIEYLKSKIDN